MTKIPITFEKEDDIEWSDLLTRNVADGIVSVKWSELNLEILFSDTEKNKYWPDIKDIKKHTPDFHFYDTFGYTINKYSEFLIIAEDWENAPDICLRDNNGIEITVGDLTPLGYYIFDIFRDNNMHPEFEWCKSIRIFGCDSENVELSLLNAINKLIYENNFSFNFCSLDSYDYWDEDESKEEIFKEISLIANSELIPNRLFYKGLKETDKANSFLDFYRVLEYYSIINQESLVDKFRNDSTISKREFVIQMNKVINDKEIVLLGKLISKIADLKILNYCEKNNLIDKAKPELLTNKLYEFRNSLVHSKMNQKLLPFTKSLFEKEDNLHEWNYVCKELANSAMIKL
jgi:hypothetical protein